MPQQDDSFRDLVRSETERITKGRKDQIAAERAVQLQKAQQEKGLATKQKQISAVQDHIEAAVQEVTREAASILSQKVAPDIRFSTEIYTPIKQTPIKRKKLFSRSHEQTAIYDSREVFFHAWILSVTAGPPGGAYSVRVPVGKDGMYETEHHWHDVNDAKLLICDSYGTLAVLVAMLWGKNRMHPEGTQVPYQPEWGPLDYGSDIVGPIYQHHPQPFSLRTIQINPTRMAIPPIPELALVGPDDIAPAEEIDPDDRGKSELVILRKWNSKLAEGVAYRLTT